jgi:ribosomal protein S18 acetylase RimI-like enzyme
VKVRYAAPQDAAAIAAIGRTGFPLAHDGIVPEDVIAAIVAKSYSEAAIAAGIARCTADPDAHFLVVERDGRVVGFLQYADAELHRIYLHADAIGSGAGHALVEELHARLGPGTSYELMVAAANERAIRFYERHGLREHRRVEGNSYYAELNELPLPPDAKPVESIVMRR